MSDYPSEYLPTNLFGTKKPPLLWVGSGIPARYVKGFLTWRSMLINAAGKADITEDQFVAIENIVKNDLGSDASDEEIMSAVALEISNMLNEKIISGDFDPAWIFTEDVLKQYRHGVDPLKLLVCSDMSDIEYKDEYADEIGLFKQLVNSTPVLITTNYDNVLETLFDNKFKIFSSIDDYYQPDSIGVGEIYKIHGTIKRPSSIILNKNDYDIFNKNSYIVSSKIVSLLCESPMVIMGYSMGDKMIRNLISRMFTSFSKEKSEQFAKNILYVGYKSGSEPQLGTMQLSSDSGTFYIRTLTVGDFSPVLRDLTNCTYSFPITVLRKLRRMVMDVVSGDPSEGKRLAYVGIEGIDDVDPKRTVVALTTNETIDVMKSYERYTTSELIEDVLNGCTLTAPSVVNIWFEKLSLSSSTFIPMFQYLRKAGRDRSSYSRKMNEFIEEKKRQYNKFKISKRPMALKSVNTHEKLMDALKTDSLKGNKDDLILYSYIDGIISESEATELLNERLKKNPSVISTTCFKRAVTLVAIREFL